MVAAAEYHSLRSVWAGYTAQEDFVRQFDKLPSPLEQLCSLATGLMLRTAEFLAALLDLFL